MLDLHAQDKITIKFKPGTIQGIVYDDMTGKPLANAVEISLDKMGKSLKRQLQEKKTVLIQHMFHGAVKHTL